MALSCIFFFNFLKKYLKEFLILFTVICNNTYLNMIWKKTAAAVLLAAAIFQGAAEAETFLCMTPEDSVAISADGNGMFYYTEMRASNGALVCPRISTDGNTYLPLRFICEIAGLTDSGNVSGEIPDNSFRYTAGTPER